jgi:hypothetical protein
VLPPRSAPQILSAEEEVAGCHIAIFNGGAQVQYYRVQRMTKEVRCQRQKWMRWSVLTNFFKRKGAKPILQATVH